MRSLFNLSSDIWSTSPWRSLHCREPQVCGTHLSSYGANICIFPPSPLPDTPFSYWDFSVHRCDMKYVLLEMDRILRPNGYAIIRESSYLVDAVSTLAKGMRWSCRKEGTEDNLEKERILVCEKKLWYSSNQNSRWRLEKPNDNIERFRGWSMKRNLLAHPGNRDCKFVPTHRLRVKNYIQIYRLKYSHLNNVTKKSLIYYRALIPYTNFLYILKFLVVPPGTRSRPFLFKEL